MTSTITYSIQRIINWYYGNFCTRKCFNKAGRIEECYVKFQLIISKNKDLKMTHKEFKDLLDNGDINICKLGPNFRRRTVGWKQFEKWLRDPLFDPDKMG